MPYKRDKLFSTINKKCLLGKLLKVCRQVGRVATKEDQSRFWEVLEQVAEPVRPFVSEEEAEYDHRRIDCLFPAAGSRAPRTKLLKFRPKRRKVNKNPFLRSTARFSKPKKKFEPNPWIDESSSNGSSGSKKVERNYKAKKRHFNEAFLKEDDKIYYVAEPDADRPTTSSIVYLKKHLKDDVPAKRKKNFNDTTTIPTQQKFVPKKSQKSTTKYNIGSIKNFEKFSSVNFNINTWTAHQLKSVYPSWFVNEERKS